MSDREKFVTTQHGAHGENVMYGKKVMGVIRSTFVIGPSSKIEHAFYGVRADGHAEKVLSKLTN